MALTTATNDLTGNTIASTYDQLLFIDGTAITNSTLYTVAAQAGETALRVANDQILIKDSSGTDIASCFEVQDKDGTICLSVNGTNNRVGIGTASPAQNLHIRADGADRTIAFSSDSDTVECVMGIDDTDDRFKIHTSTALATTSDFTIDNNGRVGIGTSEPVQPLTVAHNIADGDNGIMIVNEQTTITDGELLGAIGFDGADGNIPSSCLEASSFIAAYAAEDHGTGDKGGNLIFGCSLINEDDDVVSTKHMTILNSGKVGIGFSSASFIPDKILHVSNPAVNTAATLALTRYDGDIADTEELGEIYFGGTETGYSEWQYSAIIKANASENTWDYGVRNGGDLSFWTTPNGATAPTQKMIIQDDGNVGIGTAAPGATLEVENTSATGVPAVLIDNDDTNQIALSIVAANIDADVIDISADAVTTAAVIDITADALTSGNILYLDDDSPDTTARNCVAIVQNNNAALEATALLVKSDAGGTGMKIDKNYPAALVAADTVTGLHVDFDHTVPSSGTATQTDVGIDVDVNSATLGTSTSYGIDIDVVGATSGTHTVVGLAVDVGSADTNYAALFNGGNVGIGTTAPTQQLDITKDVASAAFIALHLQNSQTEDDTSSTVSIRMSPDAAQINAAQIECGKVSSFSSGANCDSYLAFKTIQNNGMYEQMRIMDSGNVGIGTTSPAVDLEILDGTTSSATQGGALRLTSNDQAAMQDTHRLGVIEFAAAEDGNNNIVVGASIYALAESNWDANTHTTGLVFATTPQDDSDTAATPRMIIDDLGNVGIGVTPSYPLHVTTADDDGFVGNFHNTSTNVDADCLRLLISVAAGAGAATGRWLSCEDAGGAEYELKGDGSGEIVVDASSDRRLKENIIDIPDALTMVNNLKPRRYNRKTTDASWYKYGFIADEFATVFPKRVSGEVDAMKKNDDGESVPAYQMISVQDLYGVFAKAIQELSAKVEALENA